MDKPFENSRFQNKSSLRRRSDLPDTGESIDILGGVAPKEVPAGLRL